MAKTLVVAMHEPGPAINGHDNCFARACSSGMCPGVKLAEWLNQLGDDKDFYLKPTKLCPQGTTNGQVRDNWLKSAHIVAVEPTLATLRASERREAASLRHLRRDIKRLEKAATQGARTQEGREIKR